METETIALRYGCCAIFAYADDERAPYKPPKADAPPRRCQETSKPIGECTCPKHAAERTVAGELPL